MVLGENANGGLPVLVDLSGLGLVLFVFWLQSPVGFDWSTTVLFLSQECEVFQEGIVGHRTEMPLLCLGRLE